MTPPTRHRKFASRLVAVVAGAAALALVTAGCTSSSTSTTTSGDGGTLNWASGQDPTSWDPVVDGSGAVFRVTSLAYASLTTTNEKGEAEPALAKSWKYNSDGTQVTFTLRSGLKFSDGTALDSTAVKDYFVRAQTQKTSALVGEGISVIKSIDTPDATSVVMNLSQPDYQIPLVVAERVGQITNPKYTTAQLAQKPEGAGPFKAVTVVPGSKAVFVKNPNYWDAKDIHIKNVNVSFGVDPTQVVSGLQSGVYNFADLAASQAKSAKAAGLDVVVQPGFNATNLSVNTTIAPFNNPKVLEAVQYAVNRKQIVDQADFGYGTPAYEPFPSNYIAYDKGSANKYPYNPKKAKQLLAEAGYPNGFSVTFTVGTLVPTAENELLQAQLKAVGINATLKVDPNWATSFFAKKLPISTYGTTGRDSPVQTLQAHFGATGALNSSGKDGGAAYQAAISKALATPLTSPDYQKNIQAATAAGMATTGLIFTDTLPNLFVKTKAVSSIPKIPAKVTWTGVTISGS
ncbi:ABC transporter substrate-binding protein [Frondihabitans australicus]|uniref:ABC transporter substrate-binding protein n=1 Tax=Frondihabitans australicus TaxID=386892 RepID=UPI001FE41925|nr:ABC transporter substrate-binding protein [Frondihabitans australicus]